MTIKNITVNGRSVLNNFEIFNEGSTFWSIKHNGVDHTLEEMNGYWWLDGGIALCRARTDTFKALSKALEKIKGGDQ